MTCSEPKSTSVVPIRLAPVIVTIAPPPCGPAVCEIAVTVGATGFATVMDSFAAWQVVVNPLLLLSPGYEAIQ